MQNTTIIWDWNGTLLDDIEISIMCINKMLQKRNLPLLTIDEYRRIFTFPVKDYYEIAGFDFEKEDWAAVADEFIESYYKEAYSCELHKHVVEVLEFFKNNNHRQVIISAMQNQALNAMVKDYGISEYFDEVLGIQDHYANSKQQIVENFIKRVGEGSNIIFIGDTLHDAEIAKSLNLDAILFSKGHQSYERLHASGFRIINGLEELKGAISN
ncbi:MAG: HAD family hydrolase [Lentimicrobiaceae bacterium]|nr:HAD family hydrolase [Lentimicrobiaceae bacterium]